MNVRAAFALLFSASGLVGCMHTVGTPKAPEPSPSAVTRPPREVVTADALLSAWFGCAMGEAWRAALEIPPHTWAEPSLARCHAVGQVVDAPAARLRAFVPEAVSKVSTKLGEKLGPGWGHSPMERAHALELFRLGTKALEESTYAFEAARVVARSRREAGDLSMSEPPSALRPRFYRMSRADDLVALWRFGHENAGIRSDQALALSWMIILDRVNRARSLPEELRSAHIALALEAVAGIPRPAGWTGHTAAEDWEPYLRRASEAITDEALPPASTRERHAVLVHAIAQKLRAAAHPLPTSELRRAALGCADAHFRDTSAWISEK